MRFISQKYIPGVHFLVVFLVFGLFSAEKVLGATSAPVVYAEASASYHSLLQSESRMQRRDQWTAVIRKFKAIPRGFPSTREAYKATFTIGDLYQRLYAISRRDKDLDRSLEYYRKTIEDFKSDRLSDDALLRQGEIYFSRGKYAAALEAFQAIPRKFPQGDVVAQAKKRISETRLRVHSETRSRVQTRLAVSKPVSNTIILKKIDYTTGSDSVRVVAYASHPVSFSQGRLSNPDRVYFDFERTQLGADAKREFKVESRFLKGIRLSQFDARNSRLVFDLNAVGNLKVGAWQEGSRLIIELRDENPRVAKAVSMKPVDPGHPSVPAIPVVRKKVQTPRKVLKKAATKSEAPLIVVDAGHGGKDIGARGRRGLLEKEVNLAIALRLKDILKFRHKYRVILTRKDDTFISLEGRGKIANKKNAGIFVSIHANAAKRRGAHGIETYYLGIGKSEQAQETAARENGALVKSVKDDQVQQILASLISTTKINDSSRLASRIQDRLYRSMKKKYSGVKNLGVKEGPFFVLHDTNMASVLVEVGFLTNTREESRLKQSAYLDRLANSIAQGIAEYIRERGPMI